MITNGSISVGRMKALAIERRDAAPAVLDVADPSAADGEVLVRVEAASVNGFDLAIAAGRIWDSMPHAFPVVLGRDYAGTVAAVGAGVEGFTVGQPVAGVVTGPSLGPGSIGQLYVAPAEKLTARPAAVSAVDATAVGLAGVTAATAMDALGVGAGDTLLVSGATGGVGSFAIQLATAAGARVVATAAPGEASEFVASLGATDVVDFTGDLDAAVRAIAPGGVTAVLHAAGDPVALARLLVPGGRLVSLLGATQEQVGRDDVTVTPIQSKYTPERLGRLLDAVAAGTLTVAVGKTFPLSEATEALEWFADLRHLGKVVVTLSPS
jgi:NADPH:quinone reductase-like Zn-dependent oxidoreductase